LFNGGGEIFEMDHAYDGKVVLDLNEISASDIGVELVITENGERLVARHEFSLEKTNGDRAQYSAKVTIAQPGTFTYGLRIFPKNDYLPHRQDINLVRWIG